AIKTARNTFHVSEDRSLVQTMTELLAFSTRKEIRESRVINVWKCFQELREGDMQDLLSDETITKTV
ncbi:hypothetical protein L9F63_001129, partial [Diploptera punctata]